VEHTQMHPALKKGTKNFHNISNSCGMFGDFTFHETKIPIVGRKVQVSSNFRNFFLKKMEISKFHEEWKI
jgi:hypothetical protein